MKPQARKPQTRNAASTKLRLVNVSQKTGLGSIVVQYSHSGTVKWFTTGQRVTTGQWLDAKQEIKAGALDDTTLPKAEQTQTAKANAHIRTVKANLDGIITAYIQAHGEKPSLATLEAQYDLLKAPEAPATPDRTNVLEALESFIQTKDVKPNSLKAYTSLRQNLRLYAPAAAWELETLTIADFEAFQKWLVGKEFHNTTVERRVIAMKKFLESHPGKLTFHHRDLKPVYKVKAAKNLVVITLDTDELKALEVIDLSAQPRLERIKTLFLLQCWTGLRFSDVIRLNSTHVHNDVVNIDIDKTEDFSSVPLFPASKRILDSIGPNPITVSNQEYNRVIKDVIHIISGQVPSLQKEITQFHLVGKVKVKETKAKWQWITTHTARRTFITMCIEKGVAQHFVMKWSNHSDARSFRKYQNVVQGEAKAAQQLIAAFSA